MQFELTPRVRRIGLALSLGLGIGFALYLFSANPWQWTDGDAYWQAALRLRSDQPLYLANVDGLAFHRYFYAPWFAWAWIPLTLLPKVVVTTTWQLAMVICAVAACFPARRTWPGQMLVALTLPLLLVNAIGGNVQPALVAVLAYALPRRGGPWAVGLTASLKVLPLAYLGLYAWRREWKSAAIAVVTTAVLWAPALVYGLASYPATRTLAVYDASLLLPLAVLLDGSRGNSHGGTRASGGLDT